MILKILGFILMLNSVALFGITGALASFIAQQNHPVAAIIYLVMNYVAVLSTLKIGLGLFTGQLK